MSERVQRNARGRRDAARQREQNARERAELNREQGNELLRRRHDAAADSQAAAAGAAEHLRRADVDREGEQLGAQDHPRDLRRARRG